MLLDLSRTPPDLKEVFEQDAKELYSLGMSTDSGVAARDLPTYVFAFNGVGGEVVVPPNGSVPVPASLALLGIGAVGMAMRRRRER